MAKVLLKNFREHEVTINVGDESVTIPRGVAGPAGFAPGTAFIDDSALKAARKMPAVEGMFADSWLVIDSGKAAAAEKTE